MNAATCPTDAELMSFADHGGEEEALRRHIDSCDSCRQRLAELCGALTSVRRLARSPAESAAMTAGGERAPSMIDKYMIIGRLGDRSEFESFRGLHPVLLIDLRIDVAHEFLPATPEYREPIFAEVRRLMSVEHSHLGHVRDSGFFNDRPYLVTDYGSEQRLDQRLLNAPLEPEVAGRIICDLAEAAVRLCEAGVLPAQINTRGILIRDASNAIWSDWGASALFRLRGSEVQTSLPRLLAMLYTETVHAHPNSTLDIAAARTIIVELTSNRHISLAVAKALEVAIDEPANSAAALTRLARGVSPPVGLWNRLFG